MKAHALHTCTMYSRLRICGWCCSICDFNVAARSKRASKAANDTWPRVWGLA